MMRGRLGIGGFVAYLEDVSSSVDTLASLEGGMMRVGLLGRGWMRKKQAKRPPRRHRLFFSTLKARFCVL